MLGDASTAESINRRKVEECLRGLGPDHEHTLWARLMLGWFLHAEGRYAEAETMLRETVDHFGPILGESAGMVLFAKQGLGWALRDLDRLEEARMVLREVLDGREPDSIYGREARQQLAGVLIRMDRHDEAEQLYREQVDIQRRVHGPQGIATLYTTSVLASFLKDRGPEKLAEAEDLARQATSLSRSAFGEDDELTIHLANILAVILHMRGKSEQAVSAFEDVVAAARRTTGGDGWHTTVSATHYVQALVDLTGRTDVTVEDFQDTQQIVETLIVLYDAWGRSARAAEYRALLRVAEGAEKASE
jgi:tetratricopeptide (TPR) repeat protein